MCCIHQEKGFFSKSGSDSFKDHANANIRGRITATASSGMQYGYRRIVAGFLLFTSMMARV